MSKHLFVISDDGTEYEITGARMEFDDNFVVDPDLYYYTTSEDFYYYVKDLLDAGNVIKYPKDFSKASCVLNFADDANIIVTAKAGGSGGNAISITVVDPGVPDAVFSMDVSDFDITINLATDSTANITTNLLNIESAINSQGGGAETMIEANVEYSGTTIASALSQQYLTGGDTGSTPLEASDLLVTPLDSLSLAKALARTKGKHLLKQYCDFTLLFDFFEFHVLNNKLIDAGYVITDENREAKYLEIINTGDQDLIDALETYLDARDRIAVHVHWYDSFQTYKTAVNDSVDESEVQTNFNNYTSLFD